VRMRGSISRGGGGGKRRWSRPLRGRENLRQEGSCRTTNRLTNAESSQEVIHKLSNNEFATLTGIGAAPRYAFPLPSMTGAGLEALNSDWPCPLARVFFAKTLRQNSMRRRFRTAHIERVAANENRNHNRGIGAAPAEHSGIGPKVSGYPVPSDVQSDGHSLADRAGKGHPSVERSKGSRY
jgi:hypothetical protein